MGVTFEIVPAIDVHVLRTLESPAYIRVIYEQGLRSYILVGTEKRKSKAYKPEFIDAGPGIVNEL
ncbi:hypothetical protein N7536_011853 [Penicillium majusculum]|uniref:Uncharacterized protein n=1 Tax=Penicillium solitum TaxID=60172 RepID=A0A1V6QH39_9EURO|nr:uncharacterized protein PENSOL_c070G09985 [Penicillium solitum]KAJ5680714.1 hypothetical protein N7536_011853 [Penicillium majusculum]OQD88549.1 hypothetical protein PENSOL_c070G09985 [Penicillium solitum]